MKTEQPLYATREEALAADSEIYQRYKGGEMGMGPRRKAGGAWRRGGVAQFFVRKIYVTVSAGGAGCKAFGDARVGRRI